MWYWMTVTNTPTFGEELWDFIKGIVHSMGGITFFARWMIPVIALVVLWRCVRSMLSGQEAPEVWAYLEVEGFGRVPVSHWENTIGRAASSDIVIDYPTVSRSHAVLLRDENKKWTISDLGSTGGVKVNGVPVKGTAVLTAGSTLNFAGVEARFLVTRPRSDRKNANQKVAKLLRPVHTLMLLSVFLVLTAMELLSGGEVDRTSVIVCFGGLGFLMWAYYAVMRVLVKTGVEVEMLAFFLSTIGFSVAASGEPKELYKQFFAFLLGFGLFILIGWFLRDLKRVTSVKMYVMIAAVALLFFNVVFGQVKNGARNWISLGGVSLQPSELVKVAFVFIGAGTLDMLLTKKNLFYFIGFSGVCIGALALMGDFGTASIFFVAFVVIAFMRSGDFATIALIGATVVFGVMLVLKFKPYVARRFEVWGHAWEHAYDTGYQQTRTMSAAASGGIAGVGIGNGWLRNVVAADTDLVFGVVCEEWGLIVAVLSVAAICALAAFTVKSAGNGRSSFYVIAACAAVSMMVFQTTLNTLGSVDILPLTGVTFPFVSNGGSSMLSSWGLLAFIKAADTRRNASFAAARENFQTRMMSGQPMYDAQGRRVSEMENRIGRSEYDFSKLGQLAERVRAKLIDMGVLRREADIDFAAQQEEGGAGYVEAAEPVKTVPPAVQTASAVSSVPSQVQPTMPPHASAPPSQPMGEPVSSETVRRSRQRHRYTGSDDSDTGESYIGKKHRY
ncbi:MAG: FtsW/RodA/SpoVE family cell cycle protein [Clostridia bacterium]|nr:FtsW/RodA/SpoVE family cell cycle protein [Clostridia bacterium]